MFGLNRKISNLSPVLLEDSPGDADQKIYIKNLKDTNLGLSFSPVADLGESPLILVKILKKKEELEGKAKTKILACPY